MSAPGEVAAQVLGVLAWLTIASTAVYAVVWVANRLLPRPAAGLRHALLLLVLFRLLVPPAVTSPVSALRALGGLPAVGEGFSVAPGLEALHGPLAAVVTPGSAAPAPDWAVGLVAAWAIGVCLVGVWRSSRRRRFRRLAAAGRPLVAGEPGAILERWVRLLRIRRQVRLVSVPAPVVPFTLGTLRPVIVLPERLVESPGPGAAATLEAVVAHELAHVARLDDLWLGLERLTTALFFFHPLVWWTVRATGVERELAADRRVLAVGALSSRSYGRALLYALGLGLTTTTVAAAAGNPRRLTMRMRHIADPRTARPPVQGQAIAAGAAILLGAAVLLPPPAASQSVRAVRLEGATTGLPLLAPILAEPSFDVLMPGARVTSAYGPRRYPAGSEAVLHGGVDLSSGGESPVFAPRGGVVEAAEESYGSDGHWGSVVIVDHGSGVKTFYAHLARISVKAGQGVSLGDQIGIAGSTGVSSGPHLHFELWKDGERVDPARMGEVLGGC